ncbi:MAG: hypothetical protein HY842_13905 [Bacteroidetes bacterium]|nr:hypothetical protein [Bacteroidota bacterium]
MTKTYILCLANSKKYGERCIAGIQLFPDKNDAFHPVKVDGRPKWLRPVSDTEHGQVPANLVMDICVGDILQFEAIRPCPKDYQSENILFFPGSLKKVRSAKLTVPHLDQLAENQVDMLLGNCERSLSENEIGNLRNSLVLVKPAQVQPYFTTPYNTKPRVKFRLGETNYDLPMTDVNFFDQMQEGLEALLDQTAFLTISLGISFEGRYYKLAAGMIYCQQP